ncbi:hypothetical protein Anapl_13557 [Anas platyrhynchos]|uniref:Uncharacterized protein n=1 Tax=Anas platyrhynchos TaxID=8839 RepID=R0LIV3_ANAPL|nr:hypothetical protein Anapl_13557 [Anas platyrhynchos]
MEARYPSTEPVGHSPKLGVRSDIHQKRNNRLGVRSDIHQKRINHLGVRSDIHQQCINRLGVCNRLREIQSACSVRGGRTLEAGSFWDGDCCERTELNAREHGGWMEIDCFTSLAYRESSESATLVTSKLQSPEKFRLPTVWLSCLLTISDLSEGVCLNSQDAARQEYYSHMIVGRVVQNTLLSVRISVFYGKSMQHSWSHQHFTGDVLCGYTHQDVHPVSAKQTQPRSVYSVVLVSRITSIEVLLLRAAVAWSKFTQLWQTCVVWATGAARRPNSQRSETLIPKPVTKFCRGTVTAGNFLNETSSDTCAAFGTYCKREYSTGVDPVCFATATSNTLLSQDNTVARSTHTHTHNKDTEVNEGFALLLRTEVVVTVTYRLFEYQPFAEGEFLHRGYQASQLLKLAFLTEIQLPPTEIAPDYPLEGKSDSTTTNRKKLICPQLKGFERTISKSAMAKLLHLCEHSLVKRDETSASETRCKSKQLQREGRAAYSITFLILKQPRCLLRVENHHLQCLQELSGTCCSSGKHNEPLRFPDSCLTQEQFLNSSLHFDVKSFHAASAGAYQEIMPKLLSVTNAQIYQE